MSQDSLPAPVRAGFWIVICGATLSLLADPGPSDASRAANAPPFHAADTPPCPRSEVSPNSRTTLERAEASLARVEAQLAAATDGLGRVGACMLRGPMERTARQAVGFRH